MLQTASVIGTEVSLALLQAIAGLSDAPLHHGLAHVQAAEFLYETALFPEHVYTFKHALTHEVAYGSLLQERRRVLHARIVDVLERRTDDRVSDQVERLAHHAFRGELWAKALVYLRQAGTKAMARSAHREAVTCFEQAVAVLQYLPEQRDRQEQAIDVRLDLRGARIALGEIARVLHELQEAESLAEALDDQARLGRAHGMALTEHPHGDALDLDARGPIQVRCQFFIGPVRPVESTALGAVFHPLLDRRRQCLGNPSWLARGPWDL